MGLLAMSGCGGVSGAAPEPDYQLDEPSVPEDAGWAPNLQSCEEGEIPCRGACLREVGQVENTCELLLGPDADLDLLVRDGNQLVATSSWRREMVRISLRDFEVTPLVELPGRSNALLAADGFVYFEAGANLERVPVAGGAREPVAERTADFSARPGYLLADGYVYFFGASTASVTRVPVDGGVPEVVLDEPGVVQFVVTDEHYFYVGALPEQGPFRVPRDDLDRREVIELPGFGESSVGVSASLHTWPADPDHVYVLSGRGYSKIDVDTALSEYIAGTDLFRPTLEQTTAHLTSFFGTDDASELRSAAWDTGHVEVIDQESFSGIAEDDDYYYVARYGALVRFPK
jgi:hypothetical protein